MDVADEQFWAIKKRLNYLIILMAVLVFLVVLKMGFEYSHSLHEADRLARVSIIEGRAKEKHLSGPSKVQDWIIKCALDKSEFMQKLQSGKNGKP